MPDEPEQQWLLFLPAIGMQWINANDRWHWAKRAEVVKRWRLLAAQQAMALQVPKLDRIHVTAILHFRDARRRDPANWAPTAKAAIDGLVDFGVVPDDDHTHVLGPDMRLGSKVARDETGMRLLITPVEVSGAH